MAERILQSVTAWCAPELYDQVEAAAKKQKQSTSAFAQAALEHYLKRVAHLDRLAEANADIFGIEQKEE